MSLFEGVELTSEQQAAVQANADKQYAGYESAEAIKGLKDNNASLLAEKKESVRIATEAKELADKTKADAEMGQAREKGSLDDLDKSWADKYDKLQADNKTSFDEISGKLDAERAERHNGILNSAIDKMAIDIGGSKENAHMMRPHVAQRLMMHEGDVRVKGDDGSLSALNLTELSGEFKANPLFASNIVGTLANGGGAANDQSGTGGAGSDNVNTAAQEAYKKGNLNDFLSASLGKQ